MAPLVLDKKNLGLFVSSLVISLIAFELILRLVFPDVRGIPPPPRKGWALVPERIWTEYHPVLGWVHQKSKAAILKIEGHEIPLHTNALGFRGQREYPQTKPEGVHRILVLGDSFVFGFGVRDEETFSAVLENRDPNLEMMNAGVPGYGIDQILLSFSVLGKSLKPDYVLIGIFPEDFWRATRAFADTGHAKPYFSLSAEGRLVPHNIPVPQPYTLRTNQYPLQIDRGPIENLLRVSAIYKNLKRAIIKIGKKLGWVDASSDDEWILGREILKQLIRDVRGAGASPFLVMIPPERWTKNENRDTLHQSLLQFSRREGVDFLDLTPEFLKAVQRHPSTRYYIEHDGHWTAEGHRLAAALIAAFLNQHG